MNVIKFLFGLYVKIPNDIFLLLIFHITQWSESTWIELGHGKDTCNILFPKDSSEHHCTVPISTSAVV